tara:strand:- start:3864 stop:4898 length:1035 start_codon:yes stop_codon:yes gene_type:complete
MNDFQIPLSQALGIGLVLSAVLNYTIYKYSKNINLQRNKKEKRLSTDLVPPFGGIACSMAFLISTRLIGRADDNFILIGVFAVIVSLLGIIDDIYNLRWYIKLFFQIILVFYPLHYLNLFLNIESFIGFDFNNYLNFLGSTIWIIVIINAINFIDNMDGLAVVVAGSICLQIAFLANYLNQYKITDISLLLFVTIIGFFIFNYPPAKLYLGDSGSLFIGYCLGFISILFNWTPANSTIYTSFINPLLLFFTIPLIDLLIVISYRIRSGISPTTGGTDHISHRLLAAGFTEVSVLIIFALYSVLYFVLVLFSFVNEGLVAYGSLLLLIALYIVTFSKVKKMKILG